MEILHLVALVLGLAGMAWIAVDDFRNLKIRNRDVLILTAIAAVIVATDPSGAWKSSLVVAAVLFALGFLLWAAKLVGAGDAKFYFPLGLIVGWSGVSIYVVLLLVASVVFLIVLRMEAGKPPGGGAFRRRLADIAEKRRIPYGVPMAIAAILAVILR